MPLFSWRKIYSMGMTHSFKWRNSHFIESWMELFPFQLFLNPIPKIPTPSERPEGFIRTTSMPRERTRSTASHPCGLLPSWCGLFQTIFLFIFYSPPASPRPRGILLLTFFSWGLDQFFLFFFCSVWLPRKFWELQGEIFENFENFLMRIDLRNSDLPVLKLVL